MKRLSFATETVIVRRTGLPFYDAARVIGAAQLFFGTSQATVTDRGFGWEIEGISDPGEPDLKRLWLIERLVRFERKPNNYARIHSARSSDGGQPSAIQAKWAAIRAYYQDPFAANQMETENATSLMDAAMALGSRGIDPTRYGDFAAESGSPSQQPEVELWVALLGTSHAARVNNGLFLLPIFGKAEHDDRSSGSHFTTAAYWNYERRFNHEGGEQIAATWAMLSMIESLFHHGLPLQDFAYNRADRPVYHSGTLGGAGLCRLWHGGSDRELRERALHEVTEFLRQSQREKGGHIANLARALSEFVSAPDAASLERVVRIKSRAMADEDSQATFLFREPDIVKEVLSMLKSPVPDIPEGLCQAVRRALNPTKDNKGWISGYMKLETAGTPHHFIEQAQRLISRARMDPDQGDKIYYGAEIDGGKLTDLVNQLADPKIFRAFRAAFLLRVLQAPPRRDSPLAVPTAEVGDIEVSEPEEVKE